MNALSRPTASNAASAPAADTASDAARFHLPLTAGPGLRLARAFLALGVAALIGSGVLAIVLVLSRTPGIAAVFPLRDLFRAALVVHVDLSVLIWFMAFAGLLWSVAAGHRGLALGWAGWALAALGTAVMALSPFLPDAQPLLNNYIPVLEQSAFLVGLSIAGAGFGLTILRALRFGAPAAEQPAGVAALQRGVWLAALAGGLAWGALAWTGAALPAGSGTAHFEFLFWGPGHILQFQHALLALVAWFWLADALGCRPRFGATLTGRLFVLAALPLVAALAILLLTPVGTGDQITAFAKLMQHGHLAMLPLLLAAAATLPAVWRRPPSPLKSGLLASMLLFVTGGILAFLIRGVNVVVPAHYHGSIVGVTLGFMGVVYLLLPRLGYADPDSRMARWQPWVYGGGQLMHILGLAWSGGYGVQRKVAGAEQVLVSLPQKIGMGMMGLGGLIAVIGGVMFVWVCLRCMRRGGQRHQPANSFR
ncbi:MAG TPA: cbb3-type cytochrome c oxidase subunit I [Burkholderiaceae bacterium]|nr:cbb3-type cytochrome c oxidase subunit I [Burkholderiaceae bacterium]HNG77830.1 cbb3-type cytochrome c oxidase subunit I [Burkholderiaceae bacterium]